MWHQHLRVGEEYEDNARSPFRERAVIGAGVGPVLAALQVLSREASMAHGSWRFIPVMLYVGPDVLMPVASAVAAVVGILLMFWRRTVSFVRVVAHRIAGLFSKR
jgi:hypothetical protein